MNRASAAVYAARRAALMESFPESAILVRGSGPSGANPNLFYLTGIEEPQAVLVLSATGLRVGTGRQHPGPGYLSGHPAHQVLFLPQSDAVAERWGEGAQVTLESASAADLAVDELFSASELDGWLNGWLQGWSEIAIVAAAPPSLGDKAGSRDPLIDEIRSHFLNMRFVDATATVGRMRSVKDELEVAAIERAAEVTRDGFLAAMGALRVGATEHQIEGCLTAAYRGAGATHGFGPIVGAGRNALKLHYRENHDAIDDGDLVLIDSGAHLHGYGADVARTVPANGRYSARQRELYQAVLDAQEAAIEALCPGVTLGELHAIAWKQLDRAGLANAFVHGIGHHLGIETHDAGDIHTTLEEGSVITIEPGVYLEDEGIGIRIEDDLLVTPDGCRQLSLGIPKTIDEVESFLSKARGDA